MPFCPKCGKEVSEGVQFCPNCGHDMKATGQARGGSRPMGISIIAVIQGLAGLGALLLGVLMVIVAGLLGTIELPAEVPGYFTGVVAAVIGLVLIFIGLISFVVAYGFWTGSSWAWFIGLVVNAIGVISGLASLPGGVLSILLNGFIIYYLTRPHVKRYFGKEPKTVTI